MAEFKVSPVLSFQIRSLKTKGQNLATDRVAEAEADIRTLKTSREYVQQQREIKTLLQLYADLVCKDANDMDNMMREAKRMDDEIALSHR